MHRSSRLAGACAAALVALLALTDTAAAAVPAAGDVVISEFRFDGAGASTNDYVELTNRTASPQDLSTLNIAYLDSAGARQGNYALAAVTIPVHGTYLLANAGYTLTGLAVRDGGALPTDIPPNSGLYLYNDAGTKIDAVAFSGATTADRTTFTEGTPITAFASSTTAAQYAVMRKYVSGKPTDTNSNANDFQVVGTSTTVGGLTVPFGVPGPQNLAAPQVRGQAAVTVTLVDTAKAQQASPNRGYVKGSPGVLKLRRKVTNNTGVAIGAGALRFRIVKLSSLAASSTNVDLRAVTSTSVSGDNVTSQTTLQTGGDTTTGYGGTTGGINSYVTLDSALAAGASVTFQMQFSVASASMSRNSFAVAFVPEL